MSKGIIEEERADVRAKSLLALIVVHEAISRFALLERGCECKLLGNKWVRGIYHRRGTEASRSLAAAERVDDAFGTRSRAIKLEPE